MKKKKEIEVVIKNNIDMTVQDREVQSVIETALFSRILALLKENEKEGNKLCS